MLTYGEAHEIVRSDTYDYKYNLDNIPKIRPHYNRMKPAEAGKYYTAKINKEFKRLGYVNKKKFTPEPFATPKVVRDEMLKVSDFDSVDDYYGYFEAKRFKIELGMVAA